MALANQGVGRPQRRHAIRAQPVYPITGRLAPGARHRCAGVGVALQHAPTRMAGPLAVARGAGRAEPWAPLSERPPAPGDAARDAVCRRDAAGVHQRTSMDGDKRCGQATDVDAAVWQELAATVTLGTAAVGVRTDDAAPQGGRLVVGGGRRRTGAGAAARSG